MNDVQRNKSVMQWSNRKVPLNTTYVFPSTRYSSFFNIILYNFRQSLACKDKHVIDCDARIALASTGQERLPDNQTYADTRIKASVNHVCTNVGFYAVKSGNSIAMFGTNYRSPF